jgi:hypothetical protein
MSMAFVVVLSEIGLSLENPVVGNPIGSGVVPPSAYKSGLVPSVNPIDTSGNPIVTGNMTGGMYFRGVVPYSSGTDFMAPQGSLMNTSGAFGSFLRRSAYSQGFGQRGGGINPYYSPTWTVTTTTPDGRVATPQAAGGYGSGAVSPVSKAGYDSQVGNRPLSLNWPEIEKTIEADFAKYPQGGEPVSQGQSQDEFWRQLRVPVENPKPDESDSTNSSQGNRERTGPLGLVVGSDTNVAMLLARGQVKPAGVQKEGERGLNADQKLATAAGSQRLARTFERGRGLDVYERMKMQFSRPSMGTEELTEASGKQTTGIAESNRLSEASASKGVTSTLGAGKILDTYKSFAAYSDDKFNWHMQVAERYMKQGRFYRAADAYTIATAYKPNDPLGYAGKSEALFAAGEYMSSALFLARAMEIFPEYAKVRIDLVGMVGDKDTVEKRILDIKEWFDRSQSAELAFLLSYVYYQMDRLEFARKSIEFAATKMPDSEVVKAMKKVIDERVANL